MIRIFNAKSGIDLAYEGNSFFGPFSPDGTNLFEEISFRSTYDSLEERPGIFGENHVNHRELSADVYLDPWHGTSLPAPWKYLYLNGKNASGQWTNQQVGKFSQALRPSYPWLREDSTGYSLQKKVSPTKILSIITKWSGSSLTGYTCTHIDFTMSTCDIPPKGATSVTVHSERWLAAAISGPKSKTRDKDTVLTMVQELIDYAKRFGKSYPDTSSQPYPYYSQIKRAGNTSTPRDVMLKLDWFTKDHYELPVPKGPGELAGDAIATLDSNSINMFEFLQGFKRPMDLVPKLKNLSKLKTHAGNYLGMQYGILPTISDLETLKEAILNSARPYYDSNNYQVLTAGHSAATSALKYSVTSTNRMKVCINPIDPALFTMSEKLRDIGGFPSIDNLWELIPYSFVIDWFVNIGDMLEAVDRRFRMATLPIIYGTWSSKVVIHVKHVESLTAIGASGDITISLYSRTVSEDVPSPPLSFEVSNTLPSHWLEAGALIVTARK